MKLVYKKTRTAWRVWLAKNHDKEDRGIWLVFYKKETNKPTMNYGEAVEEALCFGWIDGLIKKLDDEKYARKFMPRKLDSLWSATNKKRIDKLIKEKQMTKIGLAKVDAAKKSGLWDKDPKPIISDEVPEELVTAFKNNKSAKSTFENLSPSCRRQYIGWIQTAKRPETRAKTGRRVDCAAGTRREIGNEVSESIVVSRVA